jgi:hypothetical protein
MNTNLELLKKLSARGKTSSELNQSLVSRIDFDIDKNYLNYILDTNGGEGFLGQSYVLLYEVNDLLALNPYYEDHDFCNRIFVIGSNGGDCAYAIKKETSEFLALPFLDMNEEACQFIGKNFNEFLGSLSADS